MHVWMKLDTLDIRHMSSEDTDRGVLFHVPDIGRPVIGARGEVVAQRCEFYIPYRELMAVVDH